MRRRGLTLVELLVALALGTILIQVVASTFAHSQRAIGLHQKREDATRSMVAAFDDLARDLSGLVAAAQAPPPFSTPAAPARPLTVEAQDARPAAPRDRLRLLTLVPTPEPAPGTPSYVRAVVEWDLAPRTADPAGGPDAGALRRQIVSFERAGALVTPSPATGPAIGAVTAFEVEWQAADGSYRAPDDATRTGAQFALGGTVDLRQEPLGTEARATAGAADLDRLPIGAELRLLLDGAPSRALVRRRPAAGRVLLADRLAPRTGVAWSTFDGPAALRVTITVPFGTGPEAGTARLSRTLLVPRPR